MAREGDLSHIDEEGNARMVDTSAKPHTARRAIAEGRIELEPAAMCAVLDNTNQKGNVFAVARVAGIMAAKRTASLIPLCHPISLNHVRIDFETDEAGHSIRVLAEARTTAQTGVEMEALTAVSVALLTLYDMTKSAGKNATIGQIRLLLKEGGKSGRYARPGEEP
jgi:cyclic pyranopterin phosphate synthase